MARPDANGWRYTPGLWYRTDGARVERQQTGHRKGVWKACLPGSLSSPKMILTDGTVGSPFDPVKAAIGVAWQGFSRAAAAKAALDKIKQEKDAETAKLIREAFAPSPQPKASTTVDDDKQGWTGKPCPVCSGHGRKMDTDGEERRCTDCAGTGDEYA